VNLPAWLKRLDLDHIDRNRNVSLGNKSMNHAIIQQFAYNSWANRRVADSLRTITGSPDRPLKLFAHVLNAERIWLSRILKEPAPLPWDERTLEDCGRLLDANEHAYARFLESEAASDESRLIDYQNVQGIAFRDPLRDILQHVLLHGAYHRGQIASAVKMEGGTPASTDYILYTRENRSERA